jgi:hypothetical protein
MCSSTFILVFYNFVQVHIGIINSDYFIRGDFTTHGLHLNSQGKRKLTHLIAERIDDDHVSGVNSIPVITCARASPFLD